MNKHRKQRNQKKKKDSGNLLYSTGGSTQCFWWPRWLGWGGRRLGQEGGDICIHIADSLHCTTETGTTL